MIESLRVESPAYLRHEYRTPVNHIMGYSDLLIDEAEDRCLQPFIPLFREIRDGGEKVLEVIERAFSEETELSPGGEDGDEFRRSLGALALGLLETIGSIDDQLNRAHNETLADLTAIGAAIQRLTELTGSRPGAESSAKNAVTGANYIRAIPARGAGRILIADDDGPNRNLLRRRLVNDGHEVVEARDGLEVLSRLRESPCDLVLLDIMMPGMDGFQTLAKIKQDAELRELPVIMISALDELQSVVRCIEMGAVDYLPKPFNRVLLRARIGASLERKRLRDRERLLASHDTLTGLPNRRTVETQLEARMKRGEPFTAIYIDLNGFKKINDTYGHAAGDDLLRQVAERLRTAFRASDTMGRWGGDEFVAFVDAGAMEAGAQIARVGISLTEHFTIDGAGARVTVGAAVGAATWEPGDTASEVLHRADFAMYEEKLRRAG